MNDLMSYLAGPICAMIGGLIFFCMARREIKKDAAFFAQLDEESRRRFDELIRRLEAKLPNKQS